MLTDTPQDMLKRMATHFNDIGLYTKENQCWKIIEYIEKLEKFQDLAFQAHPNIDLDIESL